MNTPLHKQIEKDLRKQIESGYYNENETIPTEMELAQLYNVSRPTVRQAIQSLVNDGYLEKRRKRGTVVKKAKIAQEFTHVIESYDSEMNRKGIVPRTKVLTFKVDKASEDVAKNLQIKEGAHVYKLVRLRYAGNDPVVLVTTYLPKQLLPDLLDYDFRSKLLYSVLNELGKPVVTARRKLEVITAGETIGDLLDIEENDPIFYFHTIGLMESRIPIEYSISKYRGDINSFTFELSNRVIEE